MNDLQGYYKPLFDTLYGRYAAHAGLSRRALREALGAAAFPAALHRRDPGARAMAQEVLSLCLPVMEALSPAPDSGWLPYIYTYLADRMFPDACFASPTQPQAQALEFFLTVFTWLLAREREHCPFDPLTDLYMLTPEEEAESLIREEYAAFRAAVRDACFVALLRIGREIMPFDPASHTIGVHNVAVHAARMAAKAGLPVDVALVSAAALSHDAGKFGCRGKDARRVPYLHYYYTWDWLTRGGMPAIAHIAANHSTWDLEFENLQLESLLLIYADFRVRGVRDAEGRERVSIYSLSEAYGVIFGKLADMTEEKSRRYRTVYAKLRDFERFLLSCGVPSELSEDALLLPAAVDPALLTPAENAASLTNLTFRNNVLLMRMLGSSASFAELLEQARSEKNLHRIRTYLQLFEEYSTYMTREHKLHLLAFLYELLMHREGDVRRNAGRILGQILANSGPRYRKELPEGAPPAAMAPAMMALLQESTDLWEHYITLCLHPDHKISPKHAQRISNSLKTVAESLFRCVDPAEARHYLLPLYRRILSAEGNDRFVLVDTLSHVPFSLFTQEEHAALLGMLKGALAAPEARERIGALRCLLKYSAFPALRAEAAAALDALPGAPEPAVSYLCGHVRAVLCPGVPEPPALDISELYLSNLKNAVHWTVKLVQIDALSAHAAASRTDAFHIAMHLSNLLCVSEHLPVREHAGKSLVRIAEYLSVDQCNEIVIDLLRELETGQSEVARFISPCVGRLICRLPQKEFDECMDMLEALLRSANVQASCAAIRTFSVILYTVAIDAGDAFDPKDAEHILGLLLTGVAHYDATIHSTALGVLCRDFFYNSYVPLAARRACFPGVVKKLRTLLAEPREGRLDFYNQAAMLNHLYRFVTECEVAFGPFEFPPLRPAAFFPGTFDPFSAGHKRIVQEIRARGFEVYLAVDEFSWSKRTLPRLLRRQIVSMSVADFADVFLFPDDIPVNLAVPDDLARLASLFPERELFLVAGSDVIRNASAYRAGLPGGAAGYNHIVFVRDESAESVAVHPLSDVIRGKLILLSLPAYYESVSSSRIREYIDKNLDISMLLDPVVQEFIYSRGLYLRSPQLKHIIALRELYFESWRPGGPPTGCPELDARLAELERPSAALLRRRDQARPLGYALGRTLHVSGLYAALNGRAAAEAVRLKAAGRVLLIEEVRLEDAAIREGLLLLVTELLARALSGDCTSALYVSRENDPLRPTLEQMGFLPVHGQEDILIVDMRAPLVLVQDALERIKPPLHDDDAVRDVVYAARPALRRAIAAMFPGTLLLCFNTELLNQALVHRVRAAAGVERLAPGEGLGADMCVPYGKILSGEVVPNVVTKTLHADKVFDAGITGFTITEYPGYSSLANQVRTLKSFRRPVLLVDDLLHNGYRLEMLDPIFRQEDVEIRRIIVGVLSGRGKDLMDFQGRAVDCEYFIPNLRYWFTESLQYPFLGGDSVQAGRRTGGLLPSVNLIFPYACPRYLHGVPETALRSFSRVSLQNAMNILAVLERRHQVLLNTSLTLKRLPEALYRPRLPDKGMHMQYDPGAFASACLADDMALFQRLGRMEET